MSTAIFISGTLFILNASTLLVFALIGRDLELSKDSRESVIWVSIISVFIGLFFYMWANISEKNKIEGA